MDPKHYETVSEGEDSWRSNNKTGYFEKYIRIVEVDNFQITYENNEGTSFKVLVNESNVNVLTSSKVEQSMFDVNINTYFECRRQTQRTNLLVINTIYMNTNGC